MPKAMSPILPTAPEVSIVTSARPVPGGDLVDAFATGGGLTSRDSDYCLPVAGWARCPEPEDLKIRSDEHTFAEFHPWTIYVPFNCDGGKVLFSEARRSAVEGLKAKTPWALAREVWTGEHSGSVSLQAAATDVSDPGGAQPAVVAAQTLLANFEDCTGGSGATLHVPSVLIEQLVEDSYVTRVGDRLLTTCGAVVVPGPGYPNTAGNWGPLDSGGTGLAAAAGEAWMYVTGPVEFAFLDVFEMTDENDVRSGTFARMNATDLYVEREAIYRFPSCCVFGALAARST